MVPLRFAERCGCGTWCPVGRIMLLMVECAGIHYRLGGVVAAEHHEQVAHHGCLLVVVKLHYLLVAELV